MRIEKASQPLTGYVSQKVDAHKKVEEKKVKADSVDIKFNKAGNSHSVFSIKARIDNAPDVRQDRVDAVKEKIEQGQYSVDEFVSKLAEKLLDERILP